MRIQKSKTLLILFSFFSLATVSSSLVFHTETVTAKPSCTFSVNEKRTQVNRVCSDLEFNNPDESMLGTKATLTGGPQKFSRTYQAFRSQSAEKPCTETVTITAPTKGTHSISSTRGNPICGASLGQIEITAATGSGNSATKQLLATYINNQCKSQPNASLQSECRESWDFVIDQCVTQVGGSTTSNFTKKLSDCIAGKKNVKSEDIQKALKNLESDVANLDKQEACDKDNKDYSKDLKKCVERCEDGQDLDDNGQCVDKTSCAVDGIGWVVCPVLTFLGKLNDVAYGFLNNFLEVPARLFNDQATKAAWETFKNFANVAFIIAFLVIIYSQITGAGISNYGLKRLLPKLIIAAILVNVSFYICAILVDLSNIVGSSLFDLLKNINATPSTVDGGGTGSDIWSNAIAIVLGAGALIGLLAIIIFAPMTLLAFGLVILILIARQAFVILLIVISPLAFVAYLLPNTEQWFKKWWKSFTAMLMVFPIIAMVFGASSLASGILMSVSEDCKGSIGTNSNCKENGQSEGDDDQLMKIIAAAVLAVPLFAVPFLLKGSLSAAGSVGNRIASLQDRANKRSTGRFKKNAGEYAKRYGNLAKSRVLDKDGEGKILGGSNTRRRRLSRWAVGTSVTRDQKNKYAGIASDAAERNFFADKAKDESYATAIAGGNTGTANLVRAYAKQAVHEEEMKDVKAQETLMKGYNPEQLSQVMMSEAASVSERAAAARSISERGGHQHVQQAYDYLMTAQDAGIKEVQELSADALLRRKPAGVSKSNANAMASGTMSGDGYLAEFRSRIENGKFGAQEIASMDPDDHIRIAELAKSGLLSDRALSALASQLDEIEQSDTMKLTPEQKNILEHAITRETPLKEDGSPYTGSLVPLPGKNNSK